VLTGDAADLLAQFGLSEFGGETGAADELADGGHGRIRSVLGYLVNHIHTPHMPWHSFAMPSLFADGFSSTISSGISERCR
jgi:hypothetical protein